MAGATSANPRWKRVVLKLSGEALAEPSGFGLDSDVLHQIATELHETRRDLDVDIAVVVGGGNFGAVSKVQAKAWTRLKPTTWE